MKHALTLDAALLEQLLDAFRVELDEQLQCITTGLLALEKEPDARVRTDALDRIFRAAHNIKGSGRAIDVNPVADIAHRLESLFSELRRGGRSPTPATVDLCLQSVDAMRAAMRCRDAGEDVDFDLAALLDDLESASGPGSTAEEGRQVEAERASCAARVTPDTAPVPRSTRAPGAGEAPTPAATATPQSPSAPGRAEPADTHESARPVATATETIRVTTARLDAVAGLAEELQVTKIGLDDHRVSVGHLMRRLDALQGAWTRAGTQSAGAAQAELGTLHRRTRAELDELVRSVTRVHKDLRATANRVGFVSAALQSDLRTLRLMPAASLLQPLTRNVRDLARELHKQVRLEILGDDIELDRMVLDGLRDPLLHLLRNAIDHGVEAPERRLDAGKPAEGCITIEVSRRSGQILFRVRDDGAGIDAEHIGRLAVTRKLVGERELATLDHDALLDLVFRPGFSSKTSVSDVSGRGVGLDVVRSNLVQLKGSVRLHSVPGSGTSFELRVPHTLTTERGLHVLAGGERFVLPSTAVERIADVEPADVARVQGRDVVVLEGRSLLLRPLAEVLELDSPPPARPERMTVVLLNDSRHCVGLVVDEVIGEREIVVKRLQPPLLSVRNVSGATLAGDGTITVVLSPADLVAAALRGEGGARPAPAPAAPPPGPPSILVVDDSITTRTLERSILESQGYRVSVATDGAEAWDVLQRESFDLVVTDIEMPAMDGFTLTGRIKQSEPGAKLPVIIVSSLSSESEQRRGIEVGADAYIVKGQFDTQVLLDAVRRFV